MTENTMKIESYSDEEWLERFTPIRTIACAKTSLSVFDQFCQYKNGLNGKSKNLIIEQYQEWYNLDKPDIRSICLSLDKLIKFMTKDHEDIVISTNKNSHGEFHKTTFKAKTPKTIKLYFGFIKSYLRICHGVRLTTEDISDFVKFPKEKKEARRPISIETLKLLFGKCDPERRALYYVLISSGMRLGEGLSLKKSNFHLSERPIRVSLLAEDTKTGESRESYISNECYERLKPILESKNDGEYLFHKYDTIYPAVKNEVKYFIRLREKLGLTEKYPNSVRCVVNIHSFRAYFHTKASQKHGSDYANALDGHGAYLKQYYREDPKERANKYLSLEPSLLIESVKVEAENIKDNIIENLESQMVKLQAQMKRIQILNE